MLRVLSAKQAALKRVRPRAWTMPSFAASTGAVGATTMIFSNNPSSSVTAAVPARFYNSTLPASASTTLLSQQQRVLGAGDSSLWTIVGAAATLATGLAVWCLAASAEHSDSSCRRTTLCEEEAATAGVPPAKSETATDTNSDESDDEEDDPYANLPEDDEETDCTMCKTFRQGPCRPFWRKLERCFKDHESENNGSAKCMRYFTPHQTCLMDYTNLYQLISLDLKQELVSDIEQAVTPAERRTMDADAVSINWNLWREFFDEMGPSFRQTVTHHRHTEPSSEPLWKRLPLTSEGTYLEPVLIQTKATLSMTPPPSPFSGEGGEGNSGSIDNNNLLLKIAYAIDQDGFVIGLSYNSKYGDLLDEAKKMSKPKDNDSNKEDGSVKTKKEEDESEVATPASSEPLPATYDLDFYILPGECQTLRICAMYAENPVTADPSKDILDVLLYKSKSLNLQQVATAVPASGKDGPTTTKVQLVANN